MYYYVSFTYLSMYLCTALLLFRLKVSLRDVQRDRADAERKEHSAFVSVKTAIEKCNDARTKLHISRVKVESLSHTLNRFKN